MEWNGQKTDSDRREIVCEARYANAVTQYRPGRPMGASPFSRRGSMSRARGAGRPRRAVVQVEGFHSRLTADKVFSQCT